MEVISPVSPMDSDFNFPATTRKHMGDYNFSPTRLLISGDHHPNTSTAAVPFAWEEKPGVPKSYYKFLEHDFAFDLNGEFSGDSIPAEDLFHGGVIKPLVMRRGIERCSSFSSRGPPSSRSRRTQSFSLPGNWECPWEEEEKEEERGKQPSPPVTMDTKAQQLDSSVSTISETSSAKGSRKWSFRSLFLFRSASDGCTMMDGDSLQKNSAIFRRHEEEDFKNSSIRSLKHHNHGAGSRSKRRGRVSAHELHYKVNRAVAIDMKKKTFLPYKQGILGH